MTTPDTAKLSKNGWRVYAAIDERIRAQVGHLVPASVTTEQAHTLALIATAAVDAVIGDIVDEIRRREPADLIAEAMFDAAHEHCDEGGCLGGGLPWYDRPARRLTDPTGVLTHVAVEQEMQVDKWGEQNHPNGTGRDGDAEAATQAREACKANSPAEDNWRDILQEEVSEAFAETDPDRLRTELRQVAAVAASWVEAIDRRTERAGRNNHSGAAS